VSYTLTLALTLAACFTVQLLGLKIMGGKTTKCESNYFSSIARIQTGVAGKPEIMLLGSSLTGRFPDRSSGFKGVANLGCDGGSSVETLEAIDQGLLPSAPVLVIEGNTFYRSVSGQESEVAKGMRSFWFRLGLKVPSLQASARPSAFAYSYLLHRKVGRAEGPEGARFELPDRPGPAVAAVGMSAREEAFAGRVAAIIRRLEARGSKCYVVIYPPGFTGEGRTSDLPKLVAAKAGVPYWDMAAGLRPEDIVLTDGAHMAPASAAKTLRTFLAAIDSNG
jgi:hypothetical protein